MRTPPEFKALSAFALLCCLAASATTAARGLGDKDWLPVEPAHLSMKEPLVERDADAEVIFWEVRVAYQDSGADLGTVLSHYVRVKVFNERGRESQGKVDLLAPRFGGRGVKIKDVAGRTIRPDGSVVELRKEDVFERDVVRASGLKVKATSFAMPGVEPGAILEYRWREVRNGISHYERFQFARDIPAQTVKYYIKPHNDVLVDGSGRPVGLRAQTFNCEPVPFRKEKDGSYSVTRTNVRSFREEPRMPPEYAVRPWMLVYYAADGKNTPEEFWRDYARRMGEGTRPLMKPNDEVKRAAAQIVGDAAEPEQKLRRLFDYVRANVRLVTDDAPALTPEQLKKVKENKSPADTLKRGTGTHADIDLLFATLAAASGFDVRVACTSDREDIFFMRDFLSDYFIDPASIAVRVGDGWRLFNPGSSYTTFGMLRWQEEGQATLVADPKEPVWISSPVSPAARSLEKRAGRFKLSDDGTLEGDVRIEYTGHTAADMKEYNDDDSPAEREETLRERLKARLGAVEVSNVRVENVTDPDKLFQDDLPTLFSRFTLTLPAGWRAAGRVFNHPGAAPAVTGTTYTWELRDLPQIEDEPASPSFSALAPRLAVSYYPPEGAPFGGRTFATWEDVSRLMAEIEDPQAVVDDAVAAKAKQLTAGAGTEFEKIRAIGRYVQSVQYISIQTDIGRGGGYRPRTSTEVLARGYGDCKDKANLMRALLRAVGIEAYMVSIYSGDPNYVRAEWPSPMQFNHCIIAVRVGEGTQAPSVVAHARLGRLLIFDPTDDLTPVGDLPQHEQNSLALIDGADRDALVRMPVTRPEDNMRSREVEVGLSEAGAITAAVRERLAGQSAVTLRRAFRGLPRADFGKVVERWVSGGAPGAKFTKIEPTDGLDEGRFSLDVDFSAPAYAQSLQGRLLVFKPAVVARGESVWLGEPTRRNPVVLEAEAFTETVRVRLPAGFEVDEIPDGVELDSDFGKYKATYEVKDGLLIFARTLVQRAATIPAEKYAEVRRFFGRVRGSEEAPVVLARK